MTFDELKKRQEFFARNPSMHRALAIFQQQVESAEEVFGNSGNHTIEELIVKANSLEEIKIRLEIVYEAHESIKNIQAVLRQI